VSVIQRAPGPATVGLKVLLGGTRIYCHNHNRSDEPESLMLAHQDYRRAGLPKSWVAIGCMALVAIRVIMLSNSMGVRRPTMTCLEPGWSQCEIQFKIAISSRSLIVQIWWSGACYLRRERHLPIVALPPDGPIPPIETTIECVVRDLMRSNCGSGCSRPSPGHSQRCYGVIQRVIRDAGLRSGIDQIADSSIGRYLLNRAYLEFALKRDGAR
jgi:hypothetical protein